MTGAPFLMRLTCALATCGLALLLSPAAHSQSIDLSLNVYFENPADFNSGGTWKLVGKSSPGTFGIVGLDVPLTGITGTPVNEAPRGNVNGTDPAGFAIFFDLVGKFLITQQPAELSAGEVQGAFYGVGTLQNGQPGTIGPSPGSLTSLQDVPWATGDDLEAGPTWDSAATFLSGTFADNTLPNFGTGITGRVFTTIGTSTTYGQADIANITTTIRTNFNPNTTFPDYNDDGFVNAADYVVWRKGLSPGAGNAADYNAWVQHFGEAAPGSGGWPLGAVPEPASAVLLLFALISVCHTRRKRNALPLAA